MPEAPVAEEATANRINHSATVETRHLCVASSYSRKTESVPVNYTRVCAVRSSDFPVKDERLNTMRLKRRGHYWKHGII